MPQASMGATESHLLEWLVAVGDLVEADAVVALAETAKATVEVIAPATGRISQVRVPAGTDVLAGDVLATIAVPA